MKFGDGKDSFYRQLKLDKETRNAIKIYRELCRTTKYKRNNLGMGAPTSSK